MALGVIVASIAVGCLHMHGRCLLHAAISSLSIMLTCYIATAKKTVRDNPIALV